MRLLVSPRRPPSLSADRTRVAREISRDGRDKSRATPAGGRCRRCSACPEWCGRRRGNAASPAVWNDRVSGVTYSRATRMPPPFFSPPPTRIPTAFLGYYPQRQRRRGSKMSSARLYPRVRLGAVSSLDSLLEATITCGVLLRPWCAGDVSAATETDLYLSARPQ